MEILVDIDVVMRGRVEECFLHGESAERLGIIGLANKLIA